MPQTPFNMNSLPNNLHRNNLLANNKQIVLALISGSKIHHWPVSRLISAAELFDVQSATLRVVLGRLVKDGTINQVDRGVYAISEKGRHMREALQRWAYFDDLVEAWKGEWYACYTAHLGRVDRKSVVKRERALALNGFKSLEQGLWIRPANLTLSLDALKHKLINLGLEDAAYLMHVHSFSDTQKQGAENLWDVAGMEQRYRLLIDEMSKSIEALPNLSLGDAAKQTLEVGHLVVTSLGFDPLLPKEMLDTALRRKACDKMKEYDKLGQACWARFYEHLEMEDA